VPRTLIKKICSKELILKFCIAIGPSLVETTPVPLGGDFIEQMKIARAIGYDAVELHIPLPEVLDISELVKTKNELGLEIATLGTGSILGKFGLSLIEKDESKQKLLVSILHEFIDCAALLDCKVTIGSIKGNFDNAWKKNEALSSFASIVCGIAAYAKEKEVVLLLEATNRYENNILNRVEEVVDFIKENSLENVQVLVDSFHCNIEEFDLDACIEKNAPYIGHVHFADNTRWYPGSGSFRFDSFISQLKQANYDGVVSIECLPKPDSLVAANQAYHFLRNNFDPS
jgi:sugar phosphate isomerase/epimerase